MLQVSVIIPVYNSEKYLDSCITSVLNQTYNDFQLILVNDGSKDGSEDICRNYARKDKRIVVINQENKGVSAARNTGIENSTGKYITFLDSDDELEPQAIEWMVQDIEKYNADIVSMSKSIVDVDGQVIRRKDNGEIFVCENYEMIRKSLQYNRHTRALHSKLFTREMISDVRFVEGHNINEDGYFLFQCFTKKSKIVVHNLSAYKYYLRENTASHSKFSEKYLDMIYFCNLKMTYIRERFPELLAEAESMEVRTHLLFLDILCKDKTKKYKEIEKKSIQVVRRGFFKHRAYNRHHKIEALVVSLGMYPIYKVIFQIKYRKNL